jgi:hypothetical protein
MSGRKLQGKRRQEVIEKWLRGEEDPEWVVKETKTAGKYIISERRQPVEEPVSEASEGEQEHDDQPEEKEEPPAEKPPPPPPAPKPKPKPKDKPYPGKKLPKSAISDELGMEILTELRAIGEAKRAKEAKKQQKKEIRRQVRKHIPAPPPEARFVESDEYDEPEPEPQPQQFFPQRRRVNLIRPT